MNKIDLNDLVTQLDSILAQISETENRFAPELAQVHAEHTLDARNMIHYIALRHFDIRELQQKLAMLGLSSLGRAEGHVLPTLLAVRKALVAMRDQKPFDPGDEIESFRKGKLSLKSNIENLFGQTRIKRLNTIMVTLPTEAAEHGELIETLVISGMDIARINCAHDNPTIWGQLVQHVQTANQNHGKHCKIAMDLGGPKVRTGPLPSRSTVMRFKPERNAWGEVTQPARIRLVADDQMPDSETALPVAREWLASIEAEERIKLRDTRGKKRRLKIASASADGIIVECEKTIYISTGTSLELFDGEGNSKGSVAVGQLPQVEVPLILETGSRLRLTNSLGLGAPATLASDGTVIDPARIDCTLPEVFRDIKPGDSVFLDDGKIAAEVVSATEDALELSITHASPNGSKLHGDRGINFPDSRLSIRGLTEQDRENLPFIVEHADMVSMSFVKEPADVTQLQEALSQHDKPIGTVLKIETQQGFNNLPMILLTAMRSRTVGVMIARGDLAIECGWERLAEVQEEILWLCEAARMPVIWATQVLEGQTKSGRPSRAEVTDAAMSQRADCIMLGKGSHINEAITMLDNIINRMQEHQDKKTPMLRKLKISTFGA